MKRLIVILAALFVCKAAQAAVQPVSLPFSVSASSTGIASSTITVTVTTPTSSGFYSTGYSNYVSHLRIEQYAAGTLTGGATPLTCTTTNLPGNPTFKFPTAMATGTVSVLDIALDNPLAPSVSGNIAVSCPGATNVIWNILLVYYPAP